MSEKISPDVYQAELVKAHMIADIIRGIPLEEMVDLASRTEASAPFFDPTLWMKKGAVFEQDAELLRALLDFRKKLGELRKRAGLTP